MEIFKKQIKAFHYEELSQDAKETAKNWFLSDETRSGLCTDNIMEMGQIYMGLFVSGIFCSFLDMTRQNGLKSYRAIFLKRKSEPLIFI